MFSRRVARPALIAAALVVAFATGHHFSEAPLPAAQASSVTAAAAVGPSVAPSRAMSRAQLPNFSELVESQGPAVVNIAVTKHASLSPTGMEEDGPAGELLRRFGLPGAQGRGGRQMPQQESHGVGSGFIISKDGIVLTNAHVVSDASELVVRLTDRREFIGKVLGVDKLTDVAVVKIDGKNLPTVKLGDPANLRVGEWVAAIGSPFGLENSVTAGIVSAKSRALPDERLVPFIQTDVAVNPGNSGGPLFNMDGEVVGINSQIFSTSGGYMGLSFAIPIDIATAVKDQLVANGHVTRGRIGVAIQDVNSQLAETFGLDRPRGALISSVEAKSPAGKAGLKAGDVILEFNGRPLVAASDLPVLVASTRPGSTVPLKIWRDKAEKTLDISVSEMASERVADAGSQEPSHGKLGLAVHPLAADEAQAAGGDGGLLVEDATGPAARAGIQAGDIIVTANGHPTRSVDDLRKSTESSHGPVALLVQRDGARLFVPVRPS